MHQHRDNINGFTLVELMISMTFVSMLLIVIAFTAIQIINIYNKGLTMNRVAQAARSVSADFHRTLRESGTLDLGKSTFLCYQTITNSCLPDARDPRVVGGRLCTGVYSYIWNYNKKNASGIIQRVNTYSSGPSNIRFVRVEDNGGNYCARPDLRINPGVKDDILSDTGGLTLLSFDIQDKSIDLSSPQASKVASLYHIVMEVGTDDSDAITSNSFNDASCKAPSGDGEGLRYFCAVNRIDFTVLAGNNGGSI